jgi:glycosyltransferase involved in cell wall biosynthesis
LIPPDQPQAAARALKELLSDPDRMARLSEACLEDVQAYTWEARGQQVYRYIQRLLAAR